MSVLDNVLVAMHSKTKSSLFDAIFHTPRARREDKQCLARAEELLRLVDLWEERYEYASSLPYGKQRRLEIARALALDLSLLLLDEPAAGMNEQETQELLEIVRKLKQMNTTILLIEHDMKFVMNICERIYVLDYGRVIADGTPKEISSNQAVIDAYLGLAEDCDPDAVVTVPQEAVGIEGSSLYLKAGEQLTVRALLYGLLLHSATMPPSRWLWRTAARSGPLWRP